MKRKAKHRTRHLRLEELETLALPGGGRMGSGRREHASTCERCRTAVEELRQLHAVLQELAPLVPVAGLSDRVMRRVQLPVPWRVRARAAIRRHRLAAVGAFAGLAATVSVGLSVMARYPELTPATVAAYLLERSSALLWSGVMAAGRLVYGAGLVEAMREVTGLVTPLTAFVAVATVLFVGIGALRILWTLLDSRTVSRTARGR